ncbi:MAG: right-handed parallel beta-helix repeat-containing protein, partial [Herbaspirillum sp.]
GTANRFQQNVVICEDRLKGATGQRVGLSLGGGGTGPAYCRDHRCITEQDGGVIEANLIMSCSDDGIYINRSAGSKIFHNTVIDTGGVVVRFPESSADVEGNLVDASIRTRDQGILRSVDNMETSLTQTYLGWHPVRNLYVGATAFDFNWSRTAPKRTRTSHVPLDLCQREARPGMPAYGAFEKFSGCVVTRPAGVTGNSD